MARRRHDLAFPAHVCRCFVVQFKWRLLLPSLLFSLLLLLLHSQPILAMAASMRTASSMLAGTTSRVSEGLTLSTEQLRTAAGSEQVSLLDVDLTNPTLCLGVVQAHDQLVSSDETVSSMANRTAALAGVNGDYFEVNGPGRPISMVVRNGELLQSPTVYPVLSINSAGKPEITTPFLSGRVITDDASYALKSVNIYNDAGKGNMVLITPALGATISVKNETVALMWHVADIPSAFMVEMVKSDMIALPPLSGQSALIAGGAAGRWLATNVHAGMSITITKQIAPDNNLIQAIGGGPQIVKNGALYNDPHPPAPKNMTARNPLTAVGVTKDGMHVLLAAFNGRFADTQKSKGLTPAEAARYMLSHGAFQAMLFDGGGSSALVARLPGRSLVSVINSPSDGHERRVANGLFVYQATGSSSNASHLSCMHKSAG